MRSNTFVLTVLFAVLSLPVVSRAQVAFHPAGSIPDSVTAICAIVGSGHILAGTNSGIYTTADTGKTWMKLGQPGDMHITALVAMASGKILCGTQAGLYIGNDSGAWTSALPGEWVTAISDTGWVGTKDGILFAPDQTVSHWTRADSALGTGDRTITSISGGISSSDLYAATATSGILRSTNSGSSWDLISATSDRIVGIAREQDNSVLVATQASGVLRSTDFGATWNPFNVGIADLHATALVTGFGSWSALGTRSGIYGFSQYVFSATLDTMHWIKLSQGIIGTPNITALAVDRLQHLHCSLITKDIYTQWAENGFRLVLNTKSPLSFFLTNSGVDFNSGAGNAEGLFWPRGSSDSYLFGCGLWVAAKKYIPNTVEEKLGWSSTGSISATVLSLSSNPSTHHLVAATASGIYLRSDTGTKWWLAGAPALTTISSAVALPNGKILIGTTKGLYVGPEEGPWDTTEVRKNVSAISNLGVTGALGFVYTPNSDWTHWSKGPRLATGIARIASLQGDGLIVGYYAPRMFVSQDGGVRWDSIAPPANRLVTGIVLEIDRTIAISTDSGVFFSSDFGASWRAYNSGLGDLHTMALRSGDGRELAVLTRSGILTLNSNTSQWQPRTTGISWDTTIAAMDLDINGALHAALSTRNVFTTWTSSTIRPGVTEMCELGYNPNSGIGWYSPGEIGAPNDGVDPTWKYCPYLSTSFNAMNGSPTVHDRSTPMYRWPIWGQGFGVQRNFNFGTYISNVAQRDALASGVAKPVMLSDEDILSMYSDQNTWQNPEFVSNTGYPLGLNIRESMYTWGFGRYRDLIFIRYQVTNKSSDTLKECYLAPALDPDIGFPSSAPNERNSALTDSVYQAAGRPLDIYPEYKEFADNPSRLNMGYQWSNTAAKYGMIGLALVETPIVSALTREPIDAADSARLGGYGPKSLYQTNRLGLSAFRKWTIDNDPATASLRYEFVSTPGFDGFGNVSGDLRAMLSTGPFTLAPGQSTATTLAIGIAHPSTTLPNANLDSLIVLIASAHRWFASPEVINGDPNNVVIHNFGGASGGNFVTKGSVRSDVTLQAYPNPTRGKTTLHFALANDETITLMLCDEAGHELSQLRNEERFSKGVHELTLETGGLMSGRYFIRLTSSDGSISTPIVIGH